MAKKTKMISFSMDEELFKKFKTIIDKQDKNLSRVLRGFVKSYVEENGETK